MIIINGVLTGKSVGLPLTLYLVDVRVICKTVSLGSSAYNMALSMPKL